MSNFDTFTEDGYRTILQSLKSSDYAFRTYLDCDSAKHVILRHDVDYSLHRAAALAEVEAELEVKATYFLMIRSRFYSLLEPESLGLIRRILDAGQVLGLHFDPEVYGLARWTEDQLLKAVSREQQILELAIGQHVNAVSYHNPTMSNLLIFDQEEIAGLPNAYSRRMRDDYVYCSDSNGYWRHMPMPDVIAAGHLRLHLLTHPEWWTPEPMSPSARIDRAIAGRAAAARRNYDALLSAAGRLNMGKIS